MIGLIAKLLLLPFRLIFGGLNKSPSGGLIKMALLLVAVVFLLRACAGNNGGRIVQNTQRSVVPNLTVTTPPEFGRPRYHTSRENVSSVKIFTQPGCNYFVVLKDANLRTKVVDVFLQGGQESEFMVPAGEYEIESSAGITWYGDENLFGPGTQMSKGTVHVRNGVGVSFSLRYNR